MKHKHTLNFFMIALTIVAVVWVAMNFSNTSPFHEPTTPAEKALDTMLRKIGNDDYLFENAHISAGTVPAKHRVDYSKILSQRLVQSLAQQEKMLMERDCGDLYLHGVVCGFDQNPILCAPDSSDLYYYRTMQEDATNATVDYSWPYKRNVASAHYDLIKDKDGWKIDAVTCAAE